MQRGGQLLIVLGLILAIITAGLVYTATRAPETKVMTVPVVVAVQDIPERVGLEAPMLAVKQWPADAIPADAISKIEDVVGKASVTKIYAGEPLLRGKLVDARAASSLTFLIPPGMVAYTIPANESNAVAGAIQAGDSVDVLVTLRIQDVDVRTGNESKDQLTAQLTLQDVKVIGIGVWTPPRKSAPASTAGATTTDASSKPVEMRTLTVLVNQQDALVLKYASEQGTVSLALRPYNDHEKVTTDSVYITYMVDRFQFAKPPIIVRAAPAPVTVK